MCASVCVCVCVSVCLCVLVYVGCHNKIQQTGWFKQQKFIFSQFSRLGNPRSKHKFHSETTSLSLYVADIFLCAHVFFFTSMPRKKNSQVSLLKRALFPLRCVCGGGGVPTLTTSSNCINDSNVFPMSFLEFSHRYLYVWEHVHIYIYKISPESIPLMDN